MDAPQHPDRPHARPRTAPVRPRDRRVGALLGLLFIAALLAGGLLLFRVLRNTSRLQDCVLSGRTNCAPIDTTGHVQPPR